MAKWKKKYKHDGIMSKIEGERSLDKDGKVQFTGLQMLSVPNKLAAMIDFHPEITSLEVQAGIIRDAIWATGLSTLTPKSILDEVNKSEKRRLAVKEKRYILATQVSIERFRHVIPSVHINDSRLTFTKSLPKTFAKAINDNHQMQNFCTKNGCPRNYTNVRISVYAKDIFKATEKALVSINLYRGLLNLALNFGQFSYSYGADRRPINKILLGPLHSLHEIDGKMATNGLFWYEEEYRKPLKAYQETSSGLFNKILNLANGLRKELKKSKINKSLNDALLMYNEALDSYNYEVSYIKLWAALEILTGKLIDEYQEKVVKRAAFIFKDSSEVENEIRMLKDYRNSLAHKGFMNAKLEILVYELKVYVEYLFRFLVYNSKSFQNYDDVRLFLDSARNNSEISRRKRILEFAKEINNQRIS